MLVRISPSDYGVRVGWGGQLLAAGQGMTFWTWPWETYLRFPATLQWMLFSASQITRENQGVHVKGSFSWRVSDPVLAYQNLNMQRITSQEVRELLGARSCDPEKYGAIDHGPLMRTTLLIRQLAESVTRNALANMTLEQALRDRRTIIRKLMDELETLVSRWGVEIASMEIVDVTVASAEVFSNMQAEYRERIRQEARFAQIAAEEEISQHEVASASRRQQWVHDKDLAGLALQSEKGLREAGVREALERRRLEVDSDLRMQSCEADAKCRQADLDAELGRERQRLGFRREKRLAGLELLDRRQEIMGRVNDACRAQELILQLPRVVEAMRPEKSTVFANSLPAATIEGLGTTITSLLEVAGIRLPSAS